MNSHQHGEAAAASEAQAPAVPAVAALAVAGTDTTSTAVALSESAVAAAHGRLASPRPAAGGAVQRMRLEAATRAGSTPSSTRMNLGVARAAQESAILTAVRRQMEALEEKLSSQISRVQQQSDRLRDAAFARVDQKMSSMEALQPKFDRRLAELSGNFKGLSDEMQAQIKRVDQLDSRLWEWRHQLEEEIRNKSAEMEQSQQQVSSAIRLANATSDDSLKRCNHRMLRLERLVEEKLVYAEDTSQSLMNLHERLSEVEGFRAQDLAICPLEPPKPAQRLEAVEAAGDSASLVALETRFADASQKLDMFQQERHDLHVRVEAQEERLKSLRTLIETKEEQHRSLSDRVERMDTEGRLKEMQNQLHEFDQSRIEHIEKFELIGKRLEGHEQLHDETSEQLRRLQVAHAGEAAEARAAELAASADADAYPASSELTVDVQECLRRLSESEARLDSVCSDVQAAKADLELGPRVAALVEQLKQVAPKVMDQEVCVRDLHEKVGRLEVERRMEGSSAGASRSTADSTLARVGRLEIEVARMKSELEGTEMPSVHGNEVVEVSESNSKAGGESVSKLASEGTNLTRRASATE